MYQEDWIHVLSQLSHSEEPCVMVTVIATRGSAPREVGSKLLVTEQKSFLSIGGGKLEFSAIQMARDLLFTGQKSLKIEQFNLGPRLGQCCGGMVTLSFEPIGHQQNDLVLFGAGHVARALVHILSTLPFKVIWVDQREAEFPEQIPLNIHKFMSDDPAFEVRKMPEQAYYLVMTHEHQLDFEITRQILQRDDIAFFGLIGSDNKRKLFIQRLLHRGLTQEQINQMHCPVGLPMVKGKKPAEVAVSIAAQLIANYQSKEQRDIDRENPLTDREQ